MKSIKFLILIFFVTCFTVDAQVTTTHGALKLVHARATQTRERVGVRILEPQEEQVLQNPNVTVRFTLENWEPEKDGKHMHVILDNEPPQEHFTKEALLFQNVAPGAHVVRIFPVYGWHESVKQENAIAIVQFYIGEKRPLPLDLNQPMMVYNTPSGNHASAEMLPGQPFPGILIDWFLYKVSMGTRTGYFVRISVDGQALTSMKEWRPHYIQGLARGEHEIKLELLRNGVPVSQNWSVVERTIRVL